MYRYSAYILPKRTAEYRYHAPLTYSVTNNMNTLNKYEYGNKARLHELIAVGSVVPSLTRMTCNRERSLIDPASDQHHNNINNSITSVSNIIE